MGENSLYVVTLLLYVLGFFRLIILLIWFCIITLIDFSYIFGKPCPLWHVEIAESRLKNLEERAKAAEDGSDLPKLKRLPQGRKHIDYKRAVDDRDDLESRLKNGELVSQIIFVFFFFYECKLSIIIASQLYTSHRSLSNLLTQKFDRCMRNGHLQEKNLFAQNTLKSII